jgi:hypothetical protein
MRLIRDVSCLWRQPRYEEIDVGHRSDSLVVLAGRPVLSCYYAYRGYRGNWIAHREANEKRAKEHRLSTSAIVSIFCVHDMLFHFFCSLAGFLALFIAGTLYESLTSAETFDTGKSVLLIFAFLFGIAGATGRLPQLIQQGKVFGRRS